MENIPDTRPWDMEWVSTGRIQNLTDGVFAIAMTILVFNLTVPTDFATSSLQNLFQALWPQFLTYFLSFMVLSVFWVGHHNHFHFIRRSDRKFLWINIFFLSFIVLIPFSTGVLRTFFTDQLAIIAYGANVVICGAGMYWYWTYATRNHLLVEPDLSEKIITTMKDRVLIPMVLALITLGISFASPLAALFLFLIVFILVTAPTNSDHAFSFFARQIHRLGL
jgi:uncharacterized membrane protein